MTITIPVVASGGAKSTVSIADPVVGGGGGVDPFWTVFTATAPSGEGSTFTGTGTRKIYVAANGNDSNPGTQASPKLTISSGKALLRTGKPDWLLFRKGDTWTNVDFGNLSGLSGLSPTAPMLFGAYGTGPRPLFKTSIYNGAQGMGFYNGACNNIAIVGLDFYSHQRDPNSATFNATLNNVNNSGLIFNASTNYLLVEDCKFRFYGDNIVVQGIPTGVFKFRRNVVVDSYIKSTAHSQGMYIANIATPIIEENIFDHNGWNSQVGGSASPTIFNRNVYIHQDCGPATFNGNFLSASASEGMQLRTGGVMTGNFCYQNDSGFDVGHQLSEPAPTITTATITDNVVMHSLDREGRDGCGIVVLNAKGSGIQIHNNIISRSEPTGGNGLAFYLDPQCSGVVITNNIVFKWEQGILNVGGASTLAPNAIDLPGNNSAGYLAPNRDLGDYYLSVGGTNSSAAFITAARNQSKDTWNSKLTAKGAVNYIRAGFGLAPIV